MFRFCVAGISSNWHHKNMISQRLIVSNYNCLRVRTCHTLLVETIHHQHGTKGTGRNLQQKPARIVVNETFHSISQKLKLPFLKPAYTTIPIHGEGRVFKTVLTLKWPEKQSFEAIGQNKKELEELVAKQALRALQDSNIISSTGKLVFELNTHKTLQTPQKNDEPIIQHSVTENEEDFAAVEAKFPNFKSTLINCFMKVSNHMKNPNFIARPTFKHLKSKTKFQWQASYSLKWPEAKEFSGEGTTRAEAEKRAILSALCWLTKNNFLHKEGYPILYSNEELRDLKKHINSPASVKLSSVLVEELEEVLNDFKNIKPLLDENRTVFEQEIAAKSLIREDEEGIEEVEEERELEESLGNFSISSTNEWKCDENVEDPVDPLTGRRVPVLSPVEIKKRCDQLFRSAQMRLVEKTGPIIPHLPIVEERDSILDLIEKNRVIVLSGDTGCGKSTQVPQYLLDSYALKHRGTDCNMIVTQPRRLAALSLAQTVAGHRGEKVGDSVGYQVRLNSVLPNQQLGRILFCSTGILLRRLQACPKMLGISHLIIDEVHERDCLTDFTLVIIKDLLKTNPLLKVILMSASLNADLLSRYFDSAPLTHVSGRTFPVQKRFLSEIRQLTQSFGNRINTTSLKPMVDQDLLVKLVRYIDINKPSQGSILVFLPGWAEIKNLHSKLKEFYPSEETHWILPVHSKLSQTEQEWIFDRPPEGVRKIVLATNIAETSLTIPDCVYVIDPGVHKELRYNSQRGTAVMENQWVSKANVQQRAGRAGRVQPGESFHLYSQEKYEEMESFPLAEILRIPLEKVVMDIKAYDENVKSVDFLSRTLEPPTHHAIYDAIQELQSIGALDEYERLTPLGRRIATFSTHPRLAKSLVFATLFRCLDPVASIVAGLSSAREGWSVESTVDKQRHRIRQAKNRFHLTSDHLALAKLVKQFRNQRGRYEVDEFCDRFQANPKSLYFLKGVRSLLVDHLKDANLLGNRLDADSTYHPVNAYSDNEEMIKAALLMGFGDRILRVRRGRMLKGMIRSNETVILSEKHGPVHIVPDSVNAEFNKINSNYVFYFNGIFSTERKAFVVRDTTQISNITTLLTAGKSFEVENSLDSENGSVNIAIDGSKNLKFACSSRESELLMGLRYSLGETCDFLLRTAGIRQTNELASIVGKFHGRQIDLLSRLLTINDCD